MPEGSAAAAGSVPGLVAEVLAARERGDLFGGVVAELEYQSAGCAGIGSPLYAHLLSQLAADARARGLAWDILESHAAEPPLTALGLRLMAAVHRLVLEGRAPDLARHYPSAGGHLGLGGVWEAFRATCEAHRAEVIANTARPCQTNEPARAAALLGGFLEVAGATGLPLRVLEVGSSAGLNLRWDHFRYVDGDSAWGPADSPLVLDEVFESAPDLGAMARVVERRGCDPAPQDPGSEETQLNLRASAWPDQPERYADLEGALEVARRVPAVIDRAEGSAWVAEQLADGRAGVATVVFHSIVLQYLGAEQRECLVAAITSAGKSAKASAPLAWLSMEPGGGGRAHVVLTTWPGGQRRLVAEAGYHGRPVRWLGEPGVAGVGSATGY